MKFGLFSINMGACSHPEVATRVAQAAETVGFESLWAGEHVVLPDPAPRGFTMPATLPLLDTVAALTLVAAHTSTITPPAVTSGTSRVQGVARVTRSGSPAAPGAGACRRR